MTFYFFRSRAIFEILKDSSWHLLYSAKASLRPRVSVSRVDRSQSLCAEAHFLFAFVSRSEISEKFISLSLISLFVVMSLLYHTAGGTQRIFSIYFIFLWMRWCNMTHGVACIATLKKTKRLKKTLAFRKLCDTLITCRSSTLLRTQSASTEQLSRPAGCWSGFLLLLKKQGNLQESHWFVPAMGQW